MTVEIQNSKSTVNSVMRLELVGLSVLLISTSVGNISNVVDVELLMVLALCNRDQPRWIQVKYG